MPTTAYTSSIQTFFCRDRSRGLSSDDGHITIKIMAATERSGGSSNIYIVEVISPYFPFLFSFFSTEQVSGFLKGRHNCEKTTRKKPECGIRRQSAHAAYLFC
jgi:hypothetical protein